MKKKMVDHAVFINLIWKFYLKVRCAGFWSNLVPMPLVRVLLQANQFWFYFSRHFKTGKLQFELKPMLYVFKLNKRDYEMQMPQKQKSYEPVWTVLPKINIFAISAERLPLIAKPIVQLFFHFFFSLSLVVVLFFLFSLRIFFSCHTQEIPKKKCPKM